ncbi:hypothetical protein BDV96DRAFT_650700 [Lophiotrema nucula]|uniref:Uncharacterized protein n=1 Tax=Lophiotrema nucula TaxID=690887 RepID=A0A6A5YUA7_9PLEO|nr:hypothetical protein BDV96DRAFT_650700 [Lophiotrema nucula]
MQGSKRRNATTVDAADVEKLDHTTRKHPQPSTVPESPQAKKRDQDIPPPSDHVDVQRKAPSLPQAKSMSKSTVTQKTTRSVSPVVQVPAKRKRAVSIAMSDDESSDSDAPLLKRPLREKPRTAAKRLKYRPTIRASSTMTPATAKKRPASRILRDTRARKERVNGTDEETEDDDSDDSDWQDDEANNLDVVRAWLKKKGLWRDAPGKVKRALW